MKSKEIKKFREDYTKYEKPCVFEGYRLAVHFDEKDMVKSYGGRWDADEQTWWMPEKKLLIDAGVGNPSNGSLIRDVLNDNKMIMGQYGEYKGPCKGDAVEYKLKHDSSKNRVTVHWWEDSDAVQFHPSDQNGEWLGNAPDAVWYTVEKARIHWDELINGGYNRVENS